MKPAVIILARKTAFLLGLLSLISPAASEIVIRYPPPTSAPGESAPPAPTPKVDTSKDPAALKAECSRRWAQAEAIKFVLGLRVEGITPTIIVDENIWNRIDFNTKLVMVMAFNCAFFDTSNVLPAIDVRSHRTDRVIGEWRVGFTGGRLTVK